jgi:TctA family transporter
VSHCGLSPEKACGSVALDMEQRAVHWAMAPMLTGYFGLPTSPVAVAAFRARDNWSCLRSQTVRLHSRL